MKKIHELITEDTWCKGHLAEDENNQEVSINSPKACKFCAEGWLQFVYDEDHYREKLQFLRSVINNTYIHYWNDNPKTTFKKVKQAFVAADL
jgi:hypothetical protein